MDILCPKLRRAYDCFMMKLILFVLFLTHASFASNIEEVKAIGRIQQGQQGLTLIRSLEGDAIPCMLGDQNLQQVMGALQEGDEVVVEGHISYLSSQSDGKTNLKPYFNITSMKPVSLSRLGMTKMNEIPEQTPGPVLVQNFSPKTIPVTVEVASAIQMTTSLLLMQSLSANPDVSVVQQQLNFGLILFSGALATGVFIYEQVAEKKLR